jgi:cation transport protein ChaC
MMLTRDSIKQGLVHRQIAERGIVMRVLSEAELCASLEATLRGVDLSVGAWVFGYGSLIWNPAFHFTRHLTGTVYGHHRRFCLCYLMGRGLN